MSTITPNYRTITQLLQRRSFSIDDYQREYKWDRKNIEGLVTVLLGKFQAFSGSRNEGWTGPLGRVIRQAAANKTKLGEAL